MRALSAPSPFDAAELCVHEFRAIHGIPNQRVDVQDAASKLGIRLEEKSLPLSGLLLSENGSDFAIIVNSGMTPERKRFTIAHELGHYLIARKVGATLGREACQDSDEESLANTAAAEMLMPWFMVRNEAKQQRFSAATLLRLARAYGVSPTAMLHRLWRILKQEMRVDLRATIWRLGDRGVFYPETTLPSNHPQRPIQLSDGGCVAQAFRSRQATLARHYDATEGMVERLAAAWRLGAADKVLELTWPSSHVVPSESAVSQHLDLAPSGGRRKDCA